MSLGRGYSQFISIMSDRTSFDESHQSAELLATGAVNVPQ